MDHESLTKKIRARFDHEQHRRVLKEKYQARMIFGWNGGMFRASPEMISFLSLYDDQRIVIQDLYDNPVEVNAQELCCLMRSRLQEQMSAWHSEYQQSKQQR